MRTIGIVGVGAMGHALIVRLADIGVRTTVFDVAQAAMHRAAATAHAVLDSPASVAASVNVVCVFVRTDAEALDATLGAQGVLAGAARGTLVLLHSTISPATTRRIANAARSVGVTVADAPIVGIPSTVREGRAVALIGAEADVFSTIEQHLRPALQDVLHMGPLGSGNVAKIIKNLTTAAEALVIAEALRIGEAAGIPYLAALGMMTKVEQFHFIDHWRIAFDQTGTSSEPLLIPNLYDKDVPLAQLLAEELGIQAPITAVLAAAARAICARAINGP